MASVQLALGLCVVWLAGCRPPVVENAWPETDWPAAETVGELRIGRPVQHENLTIFPVYSRTAKNDDRFITLDEGLKAGTVEIMETGAVGSGVAMNSDGAVDFNNDGEVEATLGNSQVADRSSTQVDDLFADAPIEYEANDGAPGEVPNATAPLRPVDTETANRGNIGDGDDDRRRVLELIQQHDDNPGVDGDVNRLLVVNRSEKPLYLMPGEVLIGGKQDRTVGQEIVIAPSGKPVPIDAFCVEHGRWNERGAAGLAMLANGTASAETWDEAGDAPNAGELATVRPLLGFAAQSPESAAEALAEAAEKADGGQFVAPAGSVNSKVRFAIVGSQDQGDVWNEVAKTNATTGNAITDATGGFTGNYFDPQVLKKIDPYVAKLNDPIAGTDRVVGVIVAIDGKLVTMDVFESTPLFAKLWPKLLRSYALDAAIAVAEIAKADLAMGESDDVAADEAVAKTANATAATAKRPPRIADARAFLADALHSTAEETTTEDGLVMTKRSGEYCVSFTARQEHPQVPCVTSVIPVIDDPAAGGESSPGNGGNVSIGASGGTGVHTSAFGK